MSGPGYTIAIDLGKRKSGVAVFDHRGVLFHATTVRTLGGPCTPARMAKLVWIEGFVGGPAEHTWVVEHPVLYRHARVKHKDIQSLLDVEVELEALVLPGSLVRYEPRQWKGNVPKAVMKARLESQGLLPAWALSLGHDAMDAVGLGYYHLGVTGRGGARL